MVPHLVVPYTLDTNDMRFALPQGFAQADDFFVYLRDSFDALYAEGDETPKMMSIGMHCRLLGRPGRIAALQRFLDHVEAHDRVWVCAPDRHRAPLEGDPSLRPAHGVWQATHDRSRAAQSRLAGRSSPRLLDGIYEHSPWIAEARAGAAAVREPARS